MAISGKGSGRELNGAMPEALPADDVPGDVTTTSVLTPDAPVFGILDEALDQDWYRVQLTGGATYIFDLEGTATGAGTLDDPVMELLDFEGNVIASNDDFGTLNSHVVYSPPTDLSSFVAAQGFGESAGTYRLSVREMTDSIPGSTATTAVLTSSAPAEDSIDFEGDQDWYRFDIVTGRTYTFNLAGASSGAGSLGDPFLRLLDADGNEIRSASGGGEGNDALLGFTATTNGTVFVSAEGEGGAAGTYSLASREVLGDVPDNVATDAVPSIGEPQQGAVDFEGDRDWYRFEARAGQTYVVDLLASNDGSGRVINPDLILRDGDGNEISSDTDSGSGQDAQLGFVAVSDAVLFLDAGGTGRGGYQLSVQRRSGDQPGNSTTMATLEVGAITAAAVDFPSDSDWFRLDVQAGHTYVVDAKGLATLSGTLGDPRLILDDNSGEIHENFMQMWSGGTWNDLPITAGLNAFIVEREYSN